jgi:hypothetical protein
MGAWLHVSVTEDLLESANACFCYLLILLYRASAHPYSPDNLPITL